MLTMLINTKEHVSYWLTYGENVAIQVIFSFRRRNSSLSQFQALSICWPGRKCGWTGTQTSMAHESTRSWAIFGWPLLFGLFKKHVVPIELCDRFQTIRNATSNYTTIFRVSNISLKLSVTNHLVIPTGIHTGNHHGTSRLSINNCCDTDW